MNQSEEANPETPADPDGGSGQNGHDDRDRTGGGGGDGGDEGSEGGDEHGEDGDEVSSGPVSLREFVDGLPEFIGGAELMNATLDAMENAPHVHTYAGEVEPTSTEVSQSEDVRAAMRAAGDDVVINFGSSFKPEPNSVYVRTPDDLKRAYHMALHMMGAPDALSDEVISAQAEHERQHVAAFDGHNTTHAYALRFTLVHLSAEDPEAAYWNLKPFGLAAASMSKLRFAAGLIHPEVPSPEDDLVVVQDIGYKDADDVVDHILEHNRTHPDQILLPLWYRPEE